MNDRLTTPYGAWPSPIAASDVARGERRLGFPSVAGEVVWWEESRPDEGGRNTVMRRASNRTAPTELLDAPWNARTRVHEYGGRSYLPVPRGGTESAAQYGIVFAEFTDQRLYLLEPDSAAPQPLTPEPDTTAGLRYADFALASAGDRVLCVQERHDNEGGVTRSIVSVPLSGEAAEDPAAITELVTGADFYASPTPSPDGRHLAWISWYHPRMPWEGTELRAGTFTEDGEITGAYTLKGGVTESVLAPLWRDNDVLYFITDWAGWWNLYEVGLTGQAIALYPAEEEFTGGAGELGARPYCQLDDGRVIALHGNADLGISIYDPKTAELEPVDTPLSSWQVLATDGVSVVGLASSATTPQSLVRLAPDTGQIETLRRSLDELPDPGLLPSPRHETLDGRYGGAIHASVYPPTNHDATGEGPAPYVVWVHGGPIAHATSQLDLAKAYFTSRGIGVLVVNYGGSTGYGRTYRERLHGQWGVLDVEDVASAARALVEQGVADPERLAVRGSSAGGFTTLLALTGDTFACGVSAYGVTDLLQLAAETHDFESRFLDSLVGPLPGYAETYRERSPINRAADVRSPVLILQGSRDNVVPPAQATEFIKVLGENGIRHAYLEFEGEGHGFRAAESRQRALEAELAFYGEVFGFTPPGVPEIELVTERPEPAAPPEEESAAAGEAASTDAPPEAPKEPSANETAKSTVESA
ncbi:dipeptidyl aminopeptidase/acylaminoacyl peptidase [Lipingzhangella halophila]|uniref:Dipeptidyl aminopeptidase/acylaminoacyl peptidase n=1 Tax=Lipingzhangella halophila TaxID=1783352 RepID=A0A7W7REN7_9ACTN|nr:prolyl oligopeptidase family serine peptidase [Lipingzhangella halophila]MBB4930263.1 dipeptidyl aminopeptidase/acylaminoacyl peptidase [Lipingzhangella halophila]